MDIELLDVLNEKGEPTGEVRSRDECHRLGLRHRVAHVWLVTPRGEMLVQRRSSQRDFLPNLWGTASAAGHVPHGQHSRDAAIEELKEELGIVAVANELTPIYTVQRERILNNGIYLRRHIIDGYLMERVLTLAKVRPLPEEVAEVKLIPFTELERIIRSGDPSFVSAPDEYEKIFALLHARFPNQ